MKINYQEILNTNMINVLRDVLLNIEKNGLQDGHHLYITFETISSDVKIPKWLKKKYKNEMTIIIQYEYWNFKIKKKSFSIGLSFDNIKSELNIPFNSIISFSDPYANFGLKLITKNIDQIKKSPNKILKNKEKSNKDNIISFANYKKN